MSTPDSLRDRIVALLTACGPMTTGRIAATLGESPRRIAGHADPLQQQKIIRTHRIRCNTSSRVKRGELLWFIPSGEYIEKRPAPQQRIHPRKGITQEDQEWQQAALQQAAARNLARSRV